MARNQRHGREGFRGAGLVGGPQEVRHHLIHDGLLFFRNDRIADWAWSQRRVVPGPLSKAMNALGPSL